MPYCDRHNEVYSGPECPACADDGGDTAPAESGAGASGDAGAGGGIDDLVDEAVSAATDAVDDADDVVVGEQTKRVDRSTTVVDDSTEVHDRSTTVSDSVVSDSEIDAGADDGEGKTVVDDSVVNDSAVGGAGETEVEDSVLNDATVGDEHVESAVGDVGGGEPDPDPAADDESAFCIYCGTEIPATAGFCPACGEEQ